jgi:hypothetical protein
MDADLEKLMRIWKKMRTLKNKCGSGKMKADLEKSGSGK